jgi:hypothetical protein
VAGYRFLRSRILANAICAHASHYR